VLPPGASPLRNLAERSPWAGQQRESSLRHALLMTDQGRDDVEQPGQDSSRHCGVYLPQRVQVPQGPAQRTCHVTTMRRQDAAAAEAADIAAEELLRSSPETSPCRQLWSDTQCARPRFLSGRLKRIASPLTRTTRLRQRGLALVGRPEPWQIPVYLLVPPAANGRFSQRGARGTLIVRVKRPALAQHGWAWTAYM
jgi:hypothetical protein